MCHTSIGGSGRQSLSRIAAYVCEHNTFQITVTKQYRVQEFREDLKTLYRATGIDNKATSFLFSDTQVSELDIGSGELQVTIYYFCACFPSNVW